MFRRCPALNKFTSNIGILKQQALVRVPSYFKSIHKQRVQDDLHTATELSTETEPILDFPFFNPNKTTQRNSCLTKPLSIDLATSKSLGGHRMYLQKFPSVTTVLKHTKPKGEEWGLRVWRNNQIEEVGQEQFDVIKREVMKRGTSFHEEMKNIYQDPTLQLSVNKFTSGYLKSISHVLQEFRNVAAVESSVVHSSLGYAGTVDLIAEYQGQLAVVDWKTSKKPKKRLSACHSYPVQVAAYAGAVNNDQHYPFQVKHGVLVIAYDSGEPADILVMTPDHCAKYWTRWCQRLEQYKTKYNDAAINQGGGTSSQGGWTSSQGGATNDTPLLLQYSNKQSRCSSGRTVNSIGKPLQLLGKVIPEEELVESLRYSPMMTRKVFQIYRIFLSAVHIFIEYCREYFRKGK